MRKQPSALIWICREIPQHILVNLLLQINADGAVCANDFIGANTGARRNVPVRIGNADVSRIITNGVLRALYGSSDEFLKKLLVRQRSCRRVLGQCGQKSQGKEKKGEGVSHSQRDQRTDLIRCSRRRQSLACLVDGDRAVASLQGDLWPAPASVLAFEMRVATGFAGGQLQRIRLKLGINISGAAVRQDFEA